MTNQIKKDKMAAQGKTNIFLSNSYGMLWQIMVIVATLIMFFFLQYVFVCGFYEVLFDHSSPPKVSTLDGFDRLAAAEADILAGRSPAEMQERTRLAYTEILIETADDNISKMQWWTAIGMAFVTVSCALMGLFFVIYTLKTRDIDNELRSSKQRFDEENDRVVKYIQHNTIQVKNQIGMANNHVNALKDRLAANKMFIDDLDKHIDRIQYILQKTESEAIKMEKTMKPHLSTINNIDQELNKFNTSRQELADLIESVTKKHNECITIASEISLIHTRAKKLEDETLKTFQTTQAVISNHLNKAMEFPKDSEIYGTDIASLRLPDEALFHLQTISGTCHSESEEYKLAQSLRHT